MARESLVFAINELTLECGIELGRTHLFGREEGIQRLQELSEKQNTLEFVRGILDDKKGARITICEIQGDDVASARAHLRQCVDVLTALTLRTNRSKHFGHFGLPGDLVNAREDIFHVGQEGVGLGSRYAGHFQGLELDRSELAQLVSSREYKYLHGALRVEMRNEGQHRALRGCWYFAKSVRELDDGISMLLASSAIEAWVLAEREGRSLNAARTVAWFSCLGPDDLCGRDRSPCPYLLLNPSRKNDLTRLKKLKKLHDQREEAARTASRVAGRRIHPQSDGWTCSQWSRGAKWYDMRSVVAHGRVSADPDDVAEAEDERHNKRFWIATRVLDPILNWLEDHPDTPAEDLKAALKSLSTPANWETILDLIDREAFDCPCPQNPLPD